MPRLVFILLSVAFFTKARSQDGENLCTATEYVKLRAYFEGYSFNYQENDIECYRMERTYFRKNIRLSISDSSYKVVSFSITANLSDGSLVRISGGERGIEIDRNNDVTGQLYYLMKTSLVTVDNIIVSRGRQCYKAHSFICYFVK